MGGCAGVGAGVVTNFRGFLGKAQGSTHRKPRQITFCPFLVLFFLRFFFFFWVETTHILPFGDKPKHFAISTRSFLFLFGGPTYFLLAMANPKGCHFNYEFPQNPLNQTSTGCTFFWGALTLTKTKKKRSNKNVGWSARWVGWGGLLWATAGSFTPPPPSPPVG